MIPLKTIIFALMLPAVALSQTTRDGHPHPARPEPTAGNFAYAQDAEKQKFDFWQAKSDTPTPVVLLIHGGAWRANDKLDYGGDTIQPFLDAGISVASLDYRYLDEAMDQKIDPPVKAPMEDCMRALQTIRSKAKGWNIDPVRIGATGDSAGACTSLWLAFHDDMAKADSDDPVARQSTRLFCAAVSRPQTTLDPKLVHEWIPNGIYGPAAFGFIGNGLNYRTAFQKMLENREKLLPLIHEYSPIDLVTKDDPPVFLDCADEKLPTEPGKLPADPTHAAIYSVKLAEKMKEVGVEVILSYPDHRDVQYGSMEKFLTEKLKGK